MSKKKQKKINDQNDRVKKEEFKRQFIPLLIATVLWLVTISVLEMPAIKNQVAAFFINFTLQSTLFLGKVFFLPIKSSGFPNLEIAGFPMKVVMECTAYNFYVFVIFLSLLSPVSWKQRLITLVVFILAIFIVNNLRFITVGYIGSYSQKMFHFIHDYLWNILFGFMVFLIWAWRYNKSGKNEQENTAS
jgi:exosortase/archaeosortase family protein